LLWITGLLDYLAIHKTDTMNADLHLDDKKTIRAWAFFDWANSAYSLVISTAIFPIYFIAVAPETLNFFGIELSNESVYSYSIAFAYLLISLVAPLLGGIADFGNKRLAFLKAFTTVGALSCICLFFFSAEINVWIGTLAFVISTIGFAGSLIFYDSFLPRIASRPNYDKVSAMGYAYGYIGSVILLVFILFMSQKPEFFGFSAESSLPYRIGFALVGVWWLGFAQITFRRMPKDNKESLPTGFIKSGYRELRHAFSDLRKDKNLLYYLSSFFFYSAGVQTVIYLATIFAEQELAFSSGELIMTVLILQIVAILGAHIFAKVAKAKGSKQTLIILILIWMCICLAAYFTESKALFYVIAGFVGLVLGGIQSTSRAGFTKLLRSDEDDLSSFYSFYDVLFYISVVFGTFAFGLVNQLTQSLRYSVLALVVFFVLAIVLLAPMKFKGPSQH